MIFLQPQTRPRQIFSIPENLLRLTVTLNVYKFKAMSDERTVPTRAYDLLTDTERQAVDDYVSYAVKEQHRLSERIIHALYKPIPTEYIKRSRDALYKPLLKAAVAERIKEEATQQDISPDKVINEHAAIAFSDIYSYYQPDSFGQLALSPIDSLTSEQRKAVKSIEIKPGMYGVHTKLVLHDKHASLKAMGEMMGLVAPDRPPPLLEYVKPPEATRQLTEQAPEKAYAELLGE